MNCLDSQQDRDTQQRIQHSALSTQHRKPNFLPTAVMLNVEIARRRAHAESNANV